MADDYSTATSGDITITTNTAPVEAVQEVLALEPAATEPEASAEVPPAADAADAAGSRDDARDDKGRFAAAQKAKARDNPVERMKEATAKEAAAKRERDEARAQAEHYRLQLEARERAEQQARAPQPKAPPPDAEPDPADTTRYPDGQYDRQYLKDQARFEARQEFLQQQTHAREVQQRQQREQFRAQAEQTFQQRLDKAIASTPDWEARYKPDTPLDPRLVPHLMVQEDAPELMLYLSDHQDIAQRLVTLHPAAQIGEIGKIQGRLAAARERGTVARPQVSRAPAPITPLGGGSTTTDDAATDDEAFESHFARFQKEQRARR